MIVPGDEIKHFQIRQPHRDKILELPVEWGHPGLSEVTFRRTYSRQRPDGTSEDWGDCVVRCVEGMFSILKTHAHQNRIPWREERAQRHAVEAARRLHAFKWTPPGRGLQYMGTEALWIKGGAIVNNCAFVSTEDFSPTSPELTVEPFRFVMDMAMLGVGPGFDTRGAGKVGVKGNDGSPLTWYVKDDREGWIDAVAISIRNAIFGGQPVTLDVSAVRGPGVPLVLMGGTASGPEPLVRCVAGIQSVLNDLRGRDITSVVITDIMNLIGKCVVSGNIRRTAEIAFASPEDDAFADMKNFATHAVAVGAAPPDELRDECPADYDLAVKHWYTTHDGVVPALERKYTDRPWIWKWGGWRWCSNNSLFSKIGMDYEPAAQRIVQSGGDPGFEWLKLTRSYGRLKDPENNKDYRVMGTNPCGEQPLESSEICNLVETYPAHAENYWDWQRSLKFAFMYAKAVTLMGTHLESTNEVMIRNRRIGTSMSGTADVIARIGRTEFFHEWCERGFQYIGYLDRKYSDWLGVRESIKRTSMKPSGTVSLVAGVHGPGAHFPKPTGYRTMRLSSASPIVGILNAAGYRTEPSVTDPNNTTIAYFPWVVPKGRTTEADVGVWEQVKMAADLQYWWADNQVSYTATFSQDEADRGEIGRVLTAFDGQLKSISFMLRADGRYAQAPFITAPHEEVEAYAATLKPLVWPSARIHEADDKFCDGGACEIPILSVAAGA